MPKGSRNAEINAARAEAARAAQLQNYAVSESGCWLWAGGTSSDGYGKVKRFGKTLRAHRLFYEDTYGPVPDGLVVCHTCDTPLCVRPDHLFAGTPLENEQDKDRKGRRVSRFVKNHRIGPRGERHHRAKLSESAVKVIRNSTENTQRLADEHGVHRTTIQRARAGTFWRDI